MIKLNASDLDGTIIGNTQSVSENNLKAIDTLNKNNIPLVICTGKTYAISKDICKKLNANFGIFGNGSQIIDLSTGKEISKKALTLDEITSCFYLVEQYNLHAHAYTENGIVTPNPLYMDLRNSMLFPNQINFEIVDSVLEYIQAKNPIVHKLIFSSPLSLSEIKKELETNTNLNITHILKTGKYKDTIIDKEYEYLDIAPSNVTKGQALQLLMDYLKLTKEDILSIGDNLNDIDMFKISGIGAAVNNAYDDVKKIATYTTLKSADNGGFAEAIYKFIPFE